MICVTRCRPILDFVRTLPLRMMMGIIRGHGFRRIMAFNPPSARSTLESRQPVAGELLLVS